MNKKINLTEGNITKNLCLYTFHLLLSVIFQQIYNISDSIIAGKFLGEESFAAISNSYEITLIFMAVSIGSNIGCSVIISQLFGAKRYSDLKCAVYTAFIGGTILCLTMTLLGLVFLFDMLKAINTPPEIFDNCALYLKIYISGFSFMFLYNIATGVFSSMGDSITPLKFLVVSSLANIVLDILFVTKFEMKVEGIALATFIAQGGACIFALISLYKRLSSISQKTTSLFSVYFLKRISIVAIPSIIQQCFISVGNIVIQGIINEYGTAVIAGYGAGVKLNNLTITTMSTLSNSVSAFTAQNIGAQKHERIRIGFLVGLKIGAVIATIFTVLYLFFPGFLISLFISDPTPFSVKTGCEFLYILSPFYFVAVLKLVSDGVLRGSGAIRYFLCGTFADLILRVILAYIFSCYFGSVGIWLSWPIGWIVGAVISIFSYIRGVWIKKMIA